ncbi:hypothetical protein [Deinococcus sp. LM3]|nr:hypothetical protein [Deinococcus sp. LM3]
MYLIALVGVGLLVGAGLLLAIPAAWRSWRGWPVRASSWTA